MNKYSTFELVCDCGISLRMEPAGDHRSVVVLVSDNEQMQILGRLIINADEVMILQPNEIQGPTIEWMGLP